MQDRWKEIQTLFLRTADLPADEARRVLDQFCRGDAELRAEVESLLDADLNMAADLTTLVEEEVLDFLDTEVLLGERLGDYRVIREIGRGGMGSVFLAERDDDQFHKQAAIKVVRRGMDSADVQARFRRERQILANLDHPYIARLLDGGTTFDGRPYFVMEYVDGGAPLDAYLASHAPDVRKRCDLFTRVCEAVSYAHQQLVVHLDLKPANIFVTADGTPKLLDFGVAKILSPELEHGLTTGSRPITPEYASPEQVHALPPSTATDIYALGVILYEVLTGRRAHRFSSRGSREIERVVCETDPPRLSEVAPKLPQRADLEAIVFKAMRKEPALRYGSVEQLSADLGRCWNGLPVLARQGSAAYRARKFLVRNRAAIGGATLFTGLLVAGIAASTYEARRAAAAQRRAEMESARAIENQQRAEANRREAEEQARETERHRLAADEERRNADRRFEQVRQLAGKFLVDFHDSISNLPGSTKARRMVVDTGLQYYDTLVKEAHGNRDLLEEIARGYERMGDVQGNPASANLGDSKGALESYRKARAIRDSISDVSPRFQAESIRGRMKMADLLMLGGEVEEARKILNAAIRDGETSPAAQSDRVRQALADALRSYGDSFYQRGIPEPAIEPFRKYLQIYAGLVREHPEEPIYQGVLGAANSKMAGLYTMLHRPADALASARAAIEIQERLYASDHNSRYFLRQLYLAHINLARVFRADRKLDLGEEEQSNLKAAAELADRMVAADPANRTARYDVMVAEAMMGDMLRGRDNDAAGALPHYQKAVESIEKFAGGNAPALMTFDSLSYAHQRLAAALSASGRLDEALEHLRRVDEYVNQGIKADPTSKIMADRRIELLVTRGRTHQRLEHWIDAATDLSVASGLIEENSRRDPKNPANLENLASILPDLADCYANLGRIAEAVQAMETSLAKVQEIAASRPLSQDEEKARNDGLAKLAAWKRN